MNSYDLRNLVDMAEASHVFVIRREDDTLQGHMVSITNDIDGHLSAIQECSELPVSVVACVAVDNAKTVATAIQNGLEQYRSRPDGDWFRTDTDVVLAELAKHV